MSLSTFQPSRQILSWPSDVLELADHLAIPRFKILAASAGCPFALACAKEIGEDRLIATDVVSGFYPLGLETNSLLWSSRVQFYLMRRLPWAVEKGGGLLVCGACPGKAGVVPGTDDAGNGCDFG